MKVNVNLFKPSGKWAYGGVVDVDETLYLWDDAHTQDIVNKQDFVVDGAFDDYIVVVTHPDNYETIPTTYFCQHLYPRGAFAGFRKKITPAAL